MQRLIIGAFLFALIVISYIALPYIATFSYSEFKERDWVFLIGSAFGIFLGLYNVIAGEMREIQKHNAESFQNVIERTEEYPLKIQEEIGNLFAQYSFWETAAQRITATTDCQKNHITPYYYQTQSRLRVLPDKHSNLSVGCVDLVTEQYDAILLAFNILLDPASTNADLIAALRKATDAAETMVKSLQAKLSQAEP